MDQVYLFGNLKTGFRQQKKKSLFILTEISI